MSRMSELLYPASPGFKASGPSEAAASAIAPVAKTLRAKVLQVIADAPSGLTADEIATKLNQSPFSVRPRVSELRRLGEIRPADHRGTNDSGMTASLWIVSPKLGGTDE